jgi:hypothetical protein
LPDEENGRYKSNQRECIEKQCMAHEGNIFTDPEKFHDLFSFWAPDLAN